MEVPLTGSKIVVHSVSESISSDILSSISTIDFSNSSSEDIINTGSGEGNGIGDELGDSLSCCFSSRNFLNLNRGTHFSCGTCPHNLFAREVVDSPSFSLSEITLLSSGNISVDVLDVGLMSDVVGTWSIGFLGPKKNFKSMCII